MSGVKRHAPQTEAKPAKRFKTDKPSAKPGAQKADVKAKKSHAKAQKPDAEAQKPKVEELYNTKSSKEAHAKQKAIAKERKLARPNADSIQRAKKLWEKLRIKSSVPKDERRKLVDELFSIITGRVKEFVFKHDSVRTVQCALKYATPDQRKSIAQELKGDYKALAESRYAKFLLGKILVAGDESIRDMIVSEFCGSVRRLINHPEASWILDDTYRQIAKKKNKDILLREWYGPEFSVFKAGQDKETTADLLKILEQSPEKRQPIMQYLHGLINQLIQKKMHGFTMLHDAMLQYSLAISTPRSMAPSDIASTATSSAHLEWLELLKPSEEEDFDLLKNLAFTASGARVVARALALSGAKDRKLLLRPYKDHIETLACDPHGSGVLLAAYECVDDTVMLAKLLHPELLAAATPGRDARADAVAALGAHPTGRIPVLWPLTNSDAKTPKWLVKPTSAAGALVDEVRALRVATSRKQPDVRRTELARAQLTGAEGAMLAAVECRAGQLAGETLGCQFIAETLLAAESAQITSEPAMRAVAELAAGAPGEEGHIAKSPAGCRMLKTLVQRGRFNSETGSVDKVDGPEGGLRTFPAMLWEQMEENLEKWATADGSFVVVALCEDAEFDGREQVLAALKGMEAALKAAAASDAKDKEKSKSKSEAKKAASDGNAGSRLLLDLL